MVFRGGGRASNSVTKKISEKVRSWNAITGGNLRPYSTHCTRNLEGK